MKKIYIILTGPSGAGKSTLRRILESLLLNRLGFSVSVTTRAPRNNPLTDNVEIDGEDYFFTTDHGFRQKIATNEFVEFQEVYPNKWYGTLRSEIDRILGLGKIVLLDIDVKGTTNLKKLLGDDALAIFIEPISLEILEQRVRNRQTDSESEILERLARMPIEMTYRNNFDEVFVSGELAGIKQKVAEILRRHGLILDNQDAEAVLENSYHNINSYLKELMGDDGALERIANDSYQHINHFAKLILHNNPINGTKLRLHLWEKGEREVLPFSDTHDHRWSFVSMPLFGTFKEVRYIERPVGLILPTDHEVHRYTCTPRNLSYAQDLSNCTKVFVHKEGEFRRNPGRLYHCSVGTIHQFDPLTYPAASLVLTYQTVRTHALVLKNEPFDNNEAQVVSPPLKKEDVLRLLGFVLERL